MQGDVEHVLQGDARIFPRFPARRHRVRMAAAVEMALNAAVHTRQAVPDVPDARWFVAVKQLQPMTFTRAFVQVDPCASTDLSEDDALALSPVMFSGDRVLPHTIRFERGRYWVQGADGTELGAYAAFAVASKAGLDASAELISFGQGQPSAIV